MLLAAVAATLTAPVSVGIVPATIVVVGLVVVVVVAVLMGGSLVGHGHQQQIVEVN